jgi:SulP family sulfate permease
VITFRRPVELLPAPSDYAGLRTTWRRDVVAGVTVGVVALPLALAFGISSGVGAAAGLVTAVIAGLVAAVFGGSKVKVSGPTGAMAVVLAPIVATHGVGSIALVTVLAGVIVLVAGVTGLGRAVTVIPWPVVEGFTLGIATIIFVQQVPAALGSASTAGTGPLAAAYHAVTQMRWATAGPALTVVAVTVAVIVLAPRVHRAIPASLAAVVGATGAAVAVDLPVARIGALPAALPAPVLPHADLATIGSLVGAALAIAALAAIESLLSARVAATMSTTGAYDPDRELTGQGLASVAAGVFGGMPATGAIARTAVNVRSGASSRVSAIVHSLLLMAVVYLAATPVALIPLAALSAVLMTTSLRMISVSTVLRILRSTRGDAAVFVLTALITVCFDLIEAVQIGVIAAAVLALRTIARGSGVSREPLPGPAHPRDDRIALLRIHGAMFFGAAEKISTTIGAEQALDEVDVVILAMSRVDVLDATGANAVAELATQLERRGITVIVKGVAPEQARLMASIGVIDTLRNERHLVDTLEQALAHARSHLRATG